MLMLRWLVPECADEPAALLTTIDREAAILKEIHHAHLTVASQRPPGLIGELLLANLLGIISLLAERTYTKIQITTFVNANESQKSSCIHACMLIPYRVPAP